MKKILLILILFLTLTPFCYTQSTKFPKVVVVEGDSAIAITKAQYINCSHAQQLNVLYVKQLEDMQMSNDGYKSLLSNCQKENDLNEQQAVLWQKKEDNLREIIKLNESEIRKYKWYFRGAAALAIVVTGIAVLK